MGRHILNVDFPGREILARQLEQAKVDGYCRCGCKTVTLRVPHGLPRYPFAARIPVEMWVESPPTLFLLYVIDGYVNELEVLRMDGFPIDAPISLEAAQITVNPPDG